jgi:hypothetical protein
MQRNQLLNKEIELERNAVESKIIGEHQNLREQLSVREVLGLDIVAFIYRIFLFLVYNSAKI